jgi:hypothetical protein
VALGTQRGAAAAWDRPAVGAQNARLAAFWETRGQGKGVWTLARCQDGSARCPNSKTKAVVVILCNDGIDTEEEPGLRNNGVETEEEKRRMHINSNKAAHLQSRQLYCRKASLLREAC